MRGSHLLQRALRNHGVQYVFGILGREAEVLAFNQSDLKFVLTRHEVTAGFAADAYARITGRGQACFSTFGPGATNLATGVASACLDRSPMLAMSAQIETHAAVHGHVHQCIDQVAVMRPMCKYAAEVQEVSALAGHVQRAMSAAHTELYGPSYLSLPVDVLAADLPDDEAERVLDATRRREIPAPPKVDRAALDAAYELLRSATRPVIVNGAVIQREGATAEFRQVVEKFGVPVVASLSSKGVLPESHPQSFGPVNRYLDGIVKRPFMAEIFAEADLILLVGYDVAEDVKPEMYEAGRPKKIVRLSAQPNYAERVVRVDVDVRGSLKESLGLLASDAYKATQVPSGWAEGVARGLRELKRTSGSGPYNYYPTVPPQLIVRAIREAIGPEGIICSDIGIHKQYAGLLSESEKPNTFFCSQGLGSFGSGMALALGSKLAAPDVPVVAIVGDGGFHSTSSDLETLARYELPIVIVLLKDSAFGLIKYYQLRGQMTDENTVDFLPVDFAGLARANHCQGIAISSSRDFGRALQKALASSGPTLIEVPVRYQYVF